MRCLVFFLMLLTAAPAAAQSRDGIGNGRLFDNDMLGDGHDRWRTGSFVFSHLRAPRPYDRTAQPFGALLEYRFRSEIIAPYRRNGDRPYAGVLSLGLHTHFGQGDTQFSLGGDVMAIGPQTGLADFQRGFHSTFGLRRPKTQNALPDQFAIHTTAEARQTIHLGDTTTLRPFIEGQTGAEDLIRAGADLILGSAVGQRDLLLRDVVTGQLYRGTQDDAQGISFVLGGDVAAAGDSLYLPDSQGAAPRETRTRARAGVHWQPVPGLALFYGATYLGPEFKGQDESQVVGSLKLNFNF